MIDWKTTKILPYYLSQRTHVRVVCDDCGAERWATPEAARQLITPGHLCVACSTRKNNAARSKSSDLPDVQMRGGVAYVPATCPDCGALRYVRLRDGTARSCSPCARRKGRKPDRDEHGKVCPRCKAFKAFAEYTKDRRMTDRHATYCRSCVKEMRDLRGRPRRHAGLSTRQWRDLLAMYDHRCLCCGRQDARLEADHVTPIALGGQNGPENVQPLCRKCNLAKGVSIIDYRPR